MARVGCWRFGRQSNVPGKAGSCTAPLAGEPMLSRTHTHTLVYLSERLCYSCKVRQCEVVPAHTCLTRQLLGAEQASRHSYVSNGSLQFPFQKTPNHFKGSKYGADIPYYEITGRSGWSMTRLSAQDQGKSTRNLCFTPGDAREYIASGARLLTCCRTEGQST